MTGQKQLESPYALLSPHRYKRFGLCHFPSPHATRAFSRNTEDLPGEL